MALGPPYTDVRVETPDISVYDLAQMPGLMSIDLHPPASGPEIELTFGTAEGAQPADEEFMRREVERATRRPVLAIRQREGE